MSNQIKTEDEKVIEAKKMLGVDTLEQINIEVKEEVKSLKEEIKSLKEANLNQFVKASDKANIKSDFIEKGAKEIILQNYTNGEKDKSQKFQIKCNWEEKSYRTDVNVLGGFGVRPTLEQLQNITNYPNSEMIFDRMDVRSVPASTGVLIPQYKHNYDENAIQRAEGEAYTFADETGVMSLLQIELHNLAKGFKITTKAQRLQPELMNLIESQLQRDTKRMIIRNILAKTSGLRAVESIYAFLLSELGAVGASGSHIVQTATSGAVALNDIVEKMLNVPTFRMETAQNSVLAISKGFLNSITTYKNDFDYINKKFINEGSIDLGYVRVPFFIVDDEQIMSSSTSTSLAAILFDPSSYSLRVDSSSELLTMTEPHIAHRDGLREVLYSADWAGKFTNPYKAVGLLVQ